ncbi:DUF1531-domain-containing protein [Lophium mytilinum]|uniref:DUF1531-domain-containing protein n=1 Tax=Lophium mytilinum TaxID=390894 RepID=A0A6A6QY09_9PEZI|nr:DUF1531-domain-containing protein [Lophium mytilinum]
MDSPFPSATVAPDIPTLLRTWSGNLTRNTSSAFASLRLKDYIRLVIIIGGYCLLRPYIMKLGAKLQMQIHEKDGADTGFMNPNELRGAKIEIPGVESDEDDSGDEVHTGADMDFGRKARLRQRKYIREALEREEQRLRDEAEGSDAEIEEFLLKE